MKKGQTALIAILLVIIAISLFVIGYLLPSKQSISGNVVKEERVLTSTGFLTQDSGQVSSPFYLNSWNIDYDGITIGLLNTGDKSYMIEEVEISNCGTSTVKRVSDKGLLTTMVLKCPLREVESFKGDITIKYALKNSKT